MRRQLVSIAVLVSVAIAADAGVTAADLIGHWTGGDPNGGSWRNYTFRADHTFHGLGGDAESAGKWKLHDGQKLELIIHYDYDRKPISSSSPREWALVDSISKGRMRLRWYSDFNGHLLPAEVWTKQR